METRGHVHIHPHCIPNDEYQFQEEMCDLIRRYRCDTDLKMTLQKTITTPKKRIVIIAPEMTKPLMRIVTYPP